MLRLQRVFRSLAEVQTQRRSAITTDAHRQATDKNRTIAENEGFPAACDCLIRTSYFPPLLWKYNAPPGSGLSWRAVPRKRKNNLWIVPYTFQSLSACGSRFFLESQQQVYLDSSIYLGCDVFSWCHNPFLAGPRHHSATLSAGCPRNAAFALQGGGGQEGTVTTCVTVYAPDGSGESTQCYK